MTIAWIVLIGLAVLFVAFWLYSLLADFWTRKLQSYEEWTDRFFSLAGRLLDREDLPEEWVETLGTLNSWIDDQKVSIALLHTYKKDNQAKIKAAQGELPNEVQRFLEVNPSLARDYVSATRAAFLAISFLAPIKLGTDIRAEMAEQWGRVGTRDELLAEREVAAVKKASHLKLVHSAA